LQLLRCHLRKINQSILDEETTIIDANHSGTAVDQVGSSHHSAEGQYAVRGGQLARKAKFQLTHYRDTAVPAAFISAWSALLGGGGYADLFDLGVRTRKARGSAAASPA
jgi:hypothetical protein